MRILLVEPDPDLRLVFREMLETEGLEVAAFDSTDALARAARDATADTLAMGDFAWYTDSADWLDVLRELGRRLPVILVTDHPVARYASLESLGVAAVLPKPFELDDLLLTVDRIATTHDHADRKDVPIAAG